jgi:Predicted glycosyltransferases
MNKILVAIPNFNNENYICETIKSVINQQVEDAIVDIVVFDNASTDNSVQKIKLEFNSRVLIFVNAHNVGAVGNHNLCLEYAIQHRYDFLKLLSSDDILYPGIINEQLKCLVEYKEVPLISCDMLVVDENLNPIQNYSFISKFKQNTPLDGNYISTQCARDGRNYLGNPSSFLIRVSMINGLKFDSSYRWLPDLKFGCQLVSNKKFINCNRTGFLYRRHGNTDSMLISKITGLKFKEHNRFCYEFNGGLKGYVSNCKDFLKTIMKDLYYKIGL